MILEVEGRGFRIVAEFDRSLKHAQDVAGKILDLVCACAASHGRAPAASTKASSCISSRASSLSIAMVPLSRFRNESMEVGLLSIVVKSASPCGGKPAGKPCHHHARLRSQSSRRKNWDRRCPSRLQRVGLGLQRVEPEAYASSAICPVPQHLWGTQTACAGEVRPARDGGLADAPGRLNS